MRSLVLVALLHTVGGCYFGDYHDPCANQYDNSAIDPVLPAGDGTFYVRQSRLRQPAPAIDVAYLVRFDGNGGEVWRKPDATTLSFPTARFVENAALVTLTSTSMTKQPLDGSDATTVTFAGDCEARQHFSDGVILGESGYFHRPCVFTVGATAAPLLLGDETDGTWFVTTRAPDGGWVSWHNGTLWRFDAAGGNVWRASFADVGGLPSQLVYTSRGWLVGMDASIESASTVLRVSDDHATVQTLFTTPSHNIPHDGLYWEELGVVFELGDRIGVASRSFDTPPQQLTMLDEDGAIVAHTTLTVTVDAAYPAGGGVVLAGSGGGIARIDGDSVTWQRQHDRDWTIANVLDDGRYFIVAKRQTGSCSNTDKLGLFSDTGAAQWWTPEIDLR